jgi:prepilin-type N-terminal cleavage/methylation domain-containing protein
MNYPSKRSQSGVTLVETMIAAAIIAIFFATIFELNAVCLRYIDASKESVAALQGVQDRVEVLRNLAFTDLTNATVVQNLMATPANGSEFAKAKPAEVVTIKAYDTVAKATSGTGIKISRPTGAVVTPSIDLNSLVLPNLGVVLVNVKYTWNMLGGRSGSEQTETIIASGTKK